MCVKLNKGQTDEASSCKSTTETFTAASEITFFGMNYKLSSTVDIEFSDTSSMRIEDLLINYQVHSGLFPSIFSKFI